MMKISKGLCWIWLVLLVLVAGCEQRRQAEVGTSQGLAEQAEPVVASAALAANGEVGVDVVMRDLRLMRYALVFVNSRYVEPERIDWRKMTVHAIDALQNRVPEVVARFDRRLDDSPMALDLRVNVASRAFSLKEVTSLAEAHRVSTEALNFVLSNLREPQDADELEYAMINGMFSTLDPHTNLLPPYMFEDMMTSHGGFAGCGFVVGVRENKLTVISPMEGAPAWRAGIKAGDVVVRIDDESTENMPLQDAVDRMRGEAGTQVTLYILRHGWPEPRPFVITREVIQVVSVTSHALVKEGIGYIKLKSFDPTTAKEVREHLAALHKAMPKMRGLILDLRNNSGGLLNQSIEVAELFLTLGDTIVTVEGEAGTARESSRARRMGLERGYPMVVLVNEGSASASEIVAGALQYHNRAVIVGERTFGKGTVQVLKENPDGSAIKVTSAQYLTPGDISIQGVGIVPDIQLSASFVDAERGISLDTARRVRREDSLEARLLSDKTTQRSAVHTLRYLYAPAKEEEERAKALGLTTYDLRSSENYTEDDETRFAVGFLRQAEQAARGALLLASGAFFEDYQKRYEAAVHKALKALGVDWTSHSTAPRQAALDGLEVRQNLKWGLILDGVPVEAGAPLALTKRGEDLVLTMWAENSGERALERVSATLESNNPLFDEREFVFGKLDPGQRRTWDIKLKVPRSFEARDDVVTVNFRVRQARDVKLGWLPVQDACTGDDRSDNLACWQQQGRFASRIADVSRPEFAYTYWLDDVARGNRDGLLSRGESVDMHVWIRNISETNSEKTVVAIANESGSGVLLQQARVVVEGLAAGETRLVTLSFDVSKERPQKPPSRRQKRHKPFDPDAVSLILSLTDSAYNVEVSQPLTFPVSREPLVVSNPAWVQHEGVLAGSLPILSRPSADGVALGDLGGGRSVRQTALGNGYSSLCWEVSANWVCAFAADAGIQLAAPSAPPSSMATDAPRFAIMAPRVIFAPRARTENAPTATIHVTLSDNEALKSYETYVWTHNGMQVQVEKLDYAQLSGKTKQLAVEVPLRVGDNSLVVVVRNNLDIETASIFHINRPAEPPKPADSAKSAALPKSTDSLPSKDCTWCVY